MMRLSKSGSGRLDGCWDFDLAFFADGVFLASYGSRM